MEPIWPGFLIKSYKRIKSKLHYSARVIQAAANHRVHALVFDQIFFPSSQIDELIRINFPQNMKSMESYYRWISKLYAQKFGRPHMTLVDTIFRYNRRELRGHYLAGLCNGLDSERKDQSYAQ